MRGTLSSLAIIFLGLALTAQAGETVLRGEVFPAAGGDTPQFLVESGVMETDQGRIYFQRFTDRSGRTLAEIDATYRSGRLSLVKFDQHQLRETSTAEIMGGRVVYSHTAEGKTKQSTENISGGLVPAPAIPDLITSNWEELQAGKALEFTIPIPARRQSFTMKMTKTKSMSQSGRLLTEFKMEPANPVFRALGDPHYFVFDNRERTLTEFRGRIVAKSGTPGNWTDFSGRIVYQPAINSKE